MIKNAPLCSYENVCIILKEKFFILEKASYLCTGGKDSRIIRDSF